MLLTLALLSVLTATPLDTTFVGRWQIKGDVQGSPVNEICTFTQAGAVLGGSCESTDGGVVPISGELKDGKITFWHGGDYEGQPLTVIYSGTLSSPTELKGTIEVRPFNAMGTFTAAPAPATAAAPAPPKP